MTSWRVGQKLVCATECRSSELTLDKLLTGYVQAQDQGWVTIACYSARIIVSRHQAQFEKDGWQPEPREALAAVIPSLK